MLDNLDIAPEHGQAEIIHHLIGRLLDYEGLFLLPRIDWSVRHSVSEYWEVRDELNRQRAVLEDFVDTQDLICQAAIAFLEPIYEACPALLATDSGEGDITVPTELIHSLQDIGGIAERLYGIAFADELENASLFARLSDRLERNLVAASGGDPIDPKSFAKAPKLPSKSDIKNSEDLLDTYLGGTPLRNLFEQSLQLAIATQARFEHHHIVAGSGHGKSQTLQYLIVEDLDSVARGERSIVVIDGQGDLIRNISQLAEFAPSGPLHDRVVIIDPTDVEYPVSLNLFDVGIDRLNGYAPLERERLTNSILELYDFVLGTLLSAEMTQKQNIIFRYVTRLMGTSKNVAIQPDPGRIADIGAMTGRC